MKQLIDGALAHAQVSRDFVTPEDVELMTREGEGRRVVILINHGRETRSVTLPRPMADVLGQGNVSTLTLAPEGVAVLSERSTDAARKLCRPLHRRVRGERPRGLARLHAPQGRCLAPFRA